MIEKSKNKEIKSSENKSTAQEYFFSGGMEYKPVTVLASSQEEAVEKWEEVREKINN